MNHIQNIFKLYTPKYLELCGNNIQKQDQKVIDAILSCMTYENGTNKYICPNCMEIHSDLVETGTVLHVKTIKPMSGFRNNLKNYCLFNISW
jgi:siderophore synthetase component